MTMFEKIHAVQFELLAEGDVVFQGAQVLVRRDVGEDFDHLALISPPVIAVLSSPPYIRRTTTTELMPNMPKELLRMVRTWRTSRG